MRVLSLRRPGDSPPQLSSRHLSSHVRVDGTRRARMQCVSETLLHVVDHAAIPSLYPPHEYTLSRLPRGRASMRRCGHAARGSEPLSQTYSAKVPQFMRTHSPQRLSCKVAHAADPACLQLRRPTATPPLLPPPPPPPHSPSPWPSSTPAPPPARPLRRPHPPAPAQPHVRRPHPVPNPSLPLLDNPML